MSVFFTSDLHIHHVSVARMRLEEMGTRTETLTDAEIISMHDDILATNWDQRVQPEDTIWVLGDDSSGTNTSQRAAIDWLGQRPGVKHKISGNHCGTHPMHRDAHKWFRPYMEVYESIQSAGRRRISNDRGHVDALLCHFPFRGDHTEKERYTQWRLPDFGKDFILHGHTHSDRRIRGRQIHVGVDSWGYRPVHLDEIVELVFG